MLRTLRADLRRALMNRWFVVAVVATLSTLLIAISSQLSYLPSMLEFSDQPDWAHLLAEAMQGQFAALTLPALSALPAGGQALLALSTGAARYAIFRTGWRPFTLGKVVACLVCGLLVQALAIWLLVLILQGIHLSVLHSFIPFTAFEGALSSALARSLCGGIWAGLGSLLALLTATQSASSIGPLCLFYALLMVGTRFFPATPFVNPVNWLTGFDPSLLLGRVLVGAGLALLLSRKVHAYA